MTARLLCLCAGWCTTCASYAPTFEAVSERLRAEWPDLQSRWIDIEDEAELVGDLDIETFPTVVVLDHDRVRFHGTLTPQPEVLERVVRGALRGDAAPADLPKAVVEMARRIALGD